MAISVEAYLDTHPMAAWNKDTWDERDAMIDTKMHTADVFFTPLADYIAMPKGVGLGDKYYTGTELLQSHSNHNPIGTYQRFTDGIYVDTKQKSLQSRYRYGGKAQWDRLDELVTRYGNDTDAFIAAAMNANLLNNYVEVHEKIARDHLLLNARYKFTGNLSAWNDTSNNFSDIGLTNANFFNVNYLDELALRFAFRSRNVKKQYGDYANPVPGEDFRNSVLVAVPSSVMYDIWNSPAKEWLTDLRSLGDKRIINGGVAQYKNITIQDYGVALSLWNAGNIVAQLEVSSPIKWGDGAPDPELGTKVGVYLTGQGGSNVTHYIQCATGSDLSGISAGDYINIHTERTSAWGVTNGCNFLDGKTVTVEVYSVDDATDRIVLTEPITEQYDSALTAGVYAYVTKAQHIYPVYAIAARGMMVWVARAKPEWLSPTDNDADFPSIKRVTWNEYGEMNKWQDQLHEVVFCSGSFANSGRPAVR